MLRGGGLGIHVDTSWMLPWVEVPDMSILEVTQDTLERLYLSVDLEDLRIPLEELVDVDAESVVLGALLRLLPPPRWADKDGRQYFYTILCTDVEELGWILMENFDGMWLHQLYSSASQIECSNVKERLAQVILVNNVHCCE